MNFKKNFLRSNKNAKSKILKGTIDKSSKFWIVKNLRRIVLYRYFSILFQKIYFKIEKLKNSPIIKVNR